MTQPASPESPDVSWALHSAPLNAAEMSLLLQKVEDLLRAARTAEEVRTEAGEAVSFGCRADALRRLHAPLLHLGRGPLRWLAAAVNLPVLPWGRKQRRFNDDLLTLVEQMHKRLSDVQDAEDLLSDLRDRVLRQERLLQELVRPPRGSRTAGTDAER